jgi:hypothetical protein
MPSISLAKALKLKNRLAGRLNKAQTDIQLYNSVLEDKKGQVDVSALCKLREEIVSALIDVKTKIMRSNNEIQGDLILQGELKSELSWLASINVRDGKERHDYQNTDVTWVATLTKKDIDKQTHQLESKIDAIQDKLDEFNHSTKITISDRCLELAN